MIVTNDIRNQVIKSRETGETRAQTVSRLKIGKSTYDLIVRAYTAARCGDTDKLDKLSKQSAPTVRWAFGFCCVKPPKSNQPLPKVNAHDKYKPETRLYPKAKDALFSRLHFLCEMVDQAYFVDETESLWRLRFILDAFQNEVASFEKVFRRRSSAPNDVSAGVEETAHEF